MLSLRSSRNRRGTRAIVLTAAGYNLTVLTAYFLLGNRANERVQDAFGRGFIQLDSARSAWRFLMNQGRHLIETSLSTWTATDIWQPETVSWTLPLVGLGLVWLLVRRETRPVGIVVAGFYGAFLAASSLKIYPLGIDRTDIFAFPMGICLFVVGVLAITSPFPRGNLVRVALGVAVAIFAVYQPIRAEYWNVDDARLIDRLKVAIVPSDGLILSPSGAYLTSFYGDWPVTISATSGRTNATQADIVRESTAHLHPGVDIRSSIDQLLEDSRPTRIWYVSFRTRPRTDRRVLRALADQSYAVAERTRRGRLYFFLDSKD